MGTSITDICIPYQNDMTGAIDYALWRNFELREEGLQPFKVIEAKEGVYIVVSEDMCDLFKDARVIPLLDDYRDMTLLDIDARVRGDCTSFPFDVLYESLTDMTPEVLRFILAKKIPLAHVIRHILLETTEQ